MPANRLRRTVVTPALASAAAESAAAWEEDGTTACVDEDGAGFLDAHALNMATSSTAVAMERDLYFFCMAKNLIDSL